MLCSVVDDLCTLEMRQQLELVLSAFFFFFNKDVIFVGKGIVGDVLS